VCEQTRELHAARDELRLRGHVADGLSALREDASRRAPTLTANVSAGRRVDLAASSEF
jgi:hypothetical protein